MASFTDIPTSSLAPDKYVTYDLLTALRDNTLASVWHPYNKTTIGDANTGLFYDFSVHGTQASIETPAFADGYEYRIVIAGLSHNSGSSQTLKLAVYRETSAAYTSSENISVLTTSSDPIYGDVELPFSRWSWSTQIAKFTTGYASIDPVIFANSYDLTTAQKIGKAKLEYSGGSIDGGKAYLYRRGTFAA